jgi:2-haloacid dehalogenase
VTPTWVLFDLNGTLLDPSAMAEPFGAPPQLGAELLDDAVWQAMAGTLVGVYRPLPDYLREALDRRAELDGLDPGAIDEALERAAAMPPFPEAAAALDALRAAGLRVGVLTNSAAEAAERALESAGLRDRIELVAGSDAVEAFKPDPRVYAHGVERTGVAAGEVVLCAAHWWDVLGASYAGLRTAWVGRREHVLLGSVPEPDHRGVELLQVAASISAQVSSR